MIHLQSDAKKYHRRQFLKWAGYGTLGLVAGGLAPLATLKAAEPKGKPAPEAGFRPDLDISLTAQPDEIRIFPGRPTRVWRYRAQVLKGDGNRVVEMPQSYLGPTIKVNRGEKIRVRFTNAIPEPSIIHWHGLHVPAIMDGHPRHVVARGKSYLYEFTVDNRAGTYWYHPHPHGRTGPQVYLGLAGLLLVSDPNERSLGLPDGEYDLPLVIQDRTIDGDNQLFYASGHMMAQMTGFLGDRIFVNGMPDFILPVATTAYRLRLLNGSNSRIYRLAWRDGRPLTVIGTDGGLLERPVSRRYVFLAPGERIELWADFSDTRLGDETALVSLPFDGGMPGGGHMGRGMMMGGRQRLPLGAEFTVFKAKTTRRGESAAALPQKLSDEVSDRYLAAAGIERRKQFYLAMGHMRWTINGRVFQMEAVAEDEIVKSGTREIWEFANTGGGGGMHMMAMPHPIHLHGKQFRIIERSGVAHQGYVDDGWKDTVLLMPGERAKILVAFDDYPGLFLYHCHNLEHEDMGMMRNYYVKG